MTLALHKHGIPPTTKHPTIAADRADNNRLNAGGGIVTASNLMGLRRPVNPEWAEQACQGAEGKTGTSPTLADFAG